MTLIVRPAVTADVKALAVLKLATFRETFLDGFGVPYPPADLAIFEEDNYSEAKVLRELTDPTHRTWVAVAEEGALAAYAHVGPCKLPHPDVGPGQGELYQLYVRLRHQGSGVGRLLLDEALGWLQANRPGPIWLGVWSGNARAQAVYAARGFTRVGEYGFAVGTWTDHEFIYRRD